MNDQKEAALRDDPAAPRQARRAGEGHFSYQHASYEGGQHWFSAEHDGEEIGHAHVIEQQRPGSPHAEIKHLWTHPHYRGRGIGSQLLDNVAGHFGEHELRLKPYPTGKDGDQDEGQLREYYSNRGFGDYQLKDGDSFELYDYMVKPSSHRPQEKAQARAERSAAARVGFPVPAQPRPPIQGSRADAVAAARWLAGASFPVLLAGPVSTPAHAPREPGRPVPHRGRMR